MTKKIIPFSKLEDTLKQEVLKLLSDNSQKIEVNFKGQKLKATFLTKDNIQYLIPLDVVSNQEDHDFKEVDNYQSFGDLEITNL